MKAVFNVALKLLLRKVVSVMLAQQTEVIGR